MEQEQKLFEQNVAKANSDLSYLNRTKYFKLQSFEQRNKKQL